MSKKDKGFSVRCTAQEREVVTSRAKATGCNASDYIRVHLLGFDKIKGRSRPKASLPQEGKRTRLQRMRQIGELYVLSALRHLEKRIRARATLGSEDYLAIADLSVAVHMLAQEIGRRRKRLRSFEPGSEQEEPR